MAEDGYIWKPWRLGVCIPEKAREDARVGGMLVTDHLLSAAIKAGAYAASYRDDPTPRPARNEALGQKQATICEFELI